MAVGWAVPPAVDGAFVAGTAVGDDVAPPLLLCGVAVADDPQANSKATNIRTMAFGRCLRTDALNLGLGTFSSP
ncbi:MAG: hypothetical protein BZY83_04890 [SAR202 cluster bacterium Casp-Chloro-G2]|nr:MAG: hypothetical protein BZY83_04890 [SAR202 cluster bacterium Casp-Chloro-G2]